jgi:hypothetical protein
VGGIACLVAASVAGGLETMSIMKVGQMKGKIDAYKPESQERSSIRRVICASSDIRSCDWRRNERQHKRALI